MRVLLCGWRTNTLMRAAIDLVGNSNLYRAEEHQRTYVLNLDHGSEMDRRSMPNDPRGFKRKQC